MRDKDAPSTSTYLAGIVWVTLLLRSHFVASRVALARHHTVLTFALDKKDYKVCEFELLPDESRPPLESPSARSNTQIASNCLSNTST